MFNLICGARHWQVEEAKGVPLGQVAAGEVKTMATTDLYAQARTETMRWLGFDDWNRMRREPVTVYARVMALSDAEVMKLLAVLVAGTLGIGTAMVDLLGTQLSVNLRGAWSSGGVLLGLARDKPALLAMVAEVCGAEVARMHTTSTASKLRELVRNAANDNSDWLPAWLEFPQRGYTGRRLTQAAKPPA